MFGFDGLGLDISGLGSASVDKSGSSPRRVWPVTKGGEVTMMVG